MDSPQAFGHAAASARSLPHVHCLEWINSGYFLGEKKGTQQRPTVSVSFSSLLFWGRGYFDASILRPHVE